MRKVFRKTQIREIIGNPVLGSNLHKYGIPYTSSTGAVNPRNDDSLLDYLLAAEERFFPGIHIVSFLDDGHVLNRFSKDAWFCMLYIGNRDPEISFTQLIDLRQKIYNVANLIVEAEV